MFPSFTNAIIKKKIMFVMHILNLETFKVTISSCASYCELFVFCKGPTEQKK